MKCKLLVDMSAGPSAPDDLCEVMDDGARILRAGTVINHLDAWKLVHGGFAEADDEECTARVKAASPKKSGVLRAVHERVMQEQAEFLDDLDTEQDD